MNRDPVTTLTVPAAPLLRATRALAHGAALALLAVLTACGGGGAPTTVNAAPRPARHNTTAVRRRPMPTCRPS